VLATEDLILAGSTLAALIFNLNIIWNPDPVAFYLGSHPIAWYGLIWGAGVLFAYWFFLYVHKYENRDTSKALRLLEYLFFGGMIGARLGHVFFYDFAYFSQHPMEISQLWKGGMASHGGGIGMIVAALIFVRNNKDYSFSWIMDRISISVCLSVGLVRIGNLINSEIVGKVADVPWAFAFVQRDGFDPLIFRHPSQLYDALLVRMLFGFLLFLYHRKYYLKPYFLTGVFFFIAFSGRTLLEFLKEDAFVTQLLNVPFILIGIGLIFWGRNGE